MDEKDEYELVIKYFQETPILKCLYKLIFEYFYIEWYCMHYPKTFFQLTNYECKNLDYLLGRLKRGHGEFLYINSYNRISYPISNCLEINDNYYKYLIKLNMKGKIEHANYYLKRLFMCYFNLDINKWERILTPASKGIYDYYNNDLNIISETYEDINGSSSCSDSCSDSDSDSDTNFGTNISL